MSECGVETLYRNLLDRWNEGDARGFRSLFRDDGSLIGIDGTAVESAGSIGDHLSALFADHQQPTYVSKVREIRALGPDAAILRAVAGLVPPGGSHIEPELNAEQVLAAVRRNGEWRIAHFQNTPVKLDGRPGERDALSGELQALVGSSN
ncbi:MAG: SgcJ/EcaC family oxidoreductase [Ilumatobacteraceae bacterium]